jgi:hypothetical protein
MSDGASPDTPVQHAVTSNLGKISGKMYVKNRHKIRLESKLVKDLSFTVHINFEATLHLGFRSPKLVGTFPQTTYRFQRLIAPYLVYRPASSSSVYPSPLDSISSDWRKISLKASGCFTPKKRIPKMRINVRIAITKPQMPMANRKREINKSTIYLPRNVKRYSPNLEASRREMTAEGASTATQSMRMQVIAVKIPTRISR